VGFLESFAIFLAIVAAWGVAMALFARTERFKRWNLGLSLFILMVRTVRGREVIDRIAQRRGFWRLYGRLSVGLVFVTMAGITALLVWEATLVAQIPARNAPAPELLLGLPGLNPAIPLWYGIFGLAVAIIVHEFAHGILARVSRVKIQSLGLLFVYVPIGAFVEPDEAEMKALPRAERMRLFAVGPATNLLLAGAFLLSFSLVLMPSVSAYHEGAGVLYVEPGSAADAIGLRPGWIITSLNNTTVRDNLALRDALSTTQPNQTGVPLTACYHASCRDFNATLNASYNTVTGQWRGRLGIRGTDVTTAVFSPLGDGSDFPRSLLIFISLPFFGLMPLTEPYTEFYHVSGAWAAVPAPVFWVLASGAYWLFWLNLMLGATNALPAVPLDGGYLFRDGLHSLLDRLRGGVPAERRERTVRHVSYGIALAILALILWQFIGPRLNAG